MRIIRNINEMQKISSAFKCQGKTIGFVPTMGALHQGHLSLIQQARKDNRMIVVSIFVNPLQFGPREDFKRYSRPIKQDILFCEKEKVDFIFYPQPRQMYPKGFLTTVEVANLGDVLCGVSRPGHFRGVTTVVIKLFNIVQPDIAYFGRKDAQQVIIIKRMAADLNLNLKIKVMPTIRSKEGLALSSRNNYLNAKEKQNALVLSRSLSLAKDLICKGQYNCGKIIRSMKTMVNSIQGVQIDYLTVVDINTLKPLDKIQDKCLVAIAARIGKTRLIDNIVVKSVIRKL